jgi:hypothetical protein
MWKGWKTTEFRSEFYMADQEDEERKTLVKVDRRCGGLEREIGVRRWRNKAVDRNVWQGILEEV